MKVVKCYPNGTAKPGTVDLTPSSVTIYVIDQERGSKYEWPKLEKTQYETTEQFANRVVEHCTELQNKVNSPQYEDWQKFKDMLDEKGFLYK